jgi:hypothetical protein
MNKFIDQSISRRSFSGDVAKLIGLGAFAHFSLVGSIVHGGDARADAAPDNNPKDKDPCPSGEVGVDACNDKSPDKCVAGEPASDECSLATTDPDECPGGWHSVDVCPGGASPEDECPGGKVEKDLCPDGSASADECAGGGCAGGDQDIGVNAQDNCSVYPADKPHRE